MHPKLKGDIAEISVMAKLLERGYPVSKPFGDNQPYDLIVDTDTGLLRVQVRTVQYGKIQLVQHRINTKRCYTTTHKDKLEYYAGYEFSNGELYFISAKTKNVRSVSVSQCLTLDAWCTVHSLPYKQGSL